MNSLPEFVGTVHIFLGPYRGNPIALYLQRDSTNCRISPRIYPWNRIVGSGENPNRAAADFEEKWKQNDLTAEMYSGPHWEGGIKPEKPKPAVPPKPPAAATKPTGPSSDSPAAPPPTKAAAQPSSLDPSSDSPEPSSEPKKA